VLELPIIYQLRVVVVGIIRMTWAHQLRGAVMVGRIILQLNAVIINLCMYQEKVIIVVLMGVYFHTTLNVLVN